MVDNICGDELSSGTFLLCCNLNAHSQKKHPLATCPGSGSKCSDSTVAGSRAFDHLQITVHSLLLCFDYELVQMFNVQYFVLVAVR